MVKSNVRGPEFDSKHPHASSQLSAVPGGLTPSHRHAGKTPMYININKERKKGVVGGPCANGWPTSIAFRQQKSDLISG